MSQRVLENTEVYRNRLAGKDMPLQILADLYAPAAPTVVLSAPVAARNANDRRSARDFGMARRAEQRTVSTRDERAQDGGAYLKILSHSRASF